VIRRDRAKYPAPDSLDAKLASVINELAKNTTIVSTNDAAGLPWKKWSSLLVFSVYGANLDVKEKLSSLFDNKCAFCEGSLNVMDMHTEHYRPKGRVHKSDDASERGYWWLAACWGNLLPACGFCNRSPGTDHPTGIRYGSGKGMRFPLLPGSPRAAKPGDETHEKPVLLNPAIDEPSDYFTFECIARTRLWKAQTLPALAPDATMRADQSIVILGLNHPALVRERTRHMKRAALAAKGYAKAAVAYNTAVKGKVAAAALAAARHEAKEAWDELYDAYLTPECSYLHSAVRCVEQVLATHGLRLKDLAGTRSLHLPANNLK
jgi:uncharacterized protein (TIGR02646 family)